MRLILLVAFATTLVGSAYAQPAQQQTAQGGARWTCSALKARCDAKPRPNSRHNAGWDCGELMQTCMSTGTWQMGQNRGYLTNVTRQ